MITYKSKTDPNLIITSDGVIDPKFKTVFVTFPDGKIKSLSVSTLNMHYEIVEQPTSSAIPSLF